MIFLHSTPFVLDSEKLIVCGSNAYQQISLPEHIKMVSRPVNGFYQTATKSRRIVTIRIFQFSDCDLFSWTRHKRSLWSSTFSYFNTWVIITCNKKRVCMRQLPSPCSLFLGNNKVFCSGTTRKGALGFGKEMKDLKTSIFQQGFNYVWPLFLQSI